MDIKLWGVRGSFPAPLSPALLDKRLHDTVAGFLEKYPSGSVADMHAYFKALPRHAHTGFGGNTTCVEVGSGSSRIIIDGGSGIRSLGYELMAGPCGKGHGEVHILFTHVHWDHIIGLLFFTPIFIPGNRIHVYSVDSDLKDVFETLFKKPFFPVPLAQLGSIIEYHRLEPRKPADIQGIQVTPYQLDHPDPCWGFKFEKNGKVYSHCVDTECTRVTPEELGADLPLYQGVDLMLFDAQYTLMETIERVNWGHAAASLGLDIAMREGIRKVIFMHHDPASSDDKIAAAEAQARRYYKNQLNSNRRDSIARLSEVDWSFAYEGMHLSL
ncbi:MAG: MBL fold metallo-hydrolase [Bdellovibrionales bacterium GWB1_52_6]|nr:MAG: MBL fold metallo-hydrolase [Bdellovibrionales bacterium GWB1_52_6]OFZ02681.1 MAG: MBL fold metallo-hydrolase [Bdellovibrionales bacterium GWA1_52_35]HCM41517.1 MBL fold metallo-hydrolase [Bdellovibrionales bacterium]